VTPQSEPTLIIDDGVFPRRVRRPVDVVRMAGALLGIVAVLIIATIALRTFSGIGEDVKDSAAKLPAVITLVLGFVSGLGTLVLPVVVAVNLLSRRRARLLLEAALSFVAAGLLLAALNRAAQLYGSADFWFGLAGTTERGVTPLQPFLAGVFALLTVARVRGRLSSFAAFIMSATLAADVINGASTTAALISSVLFGWAVGLGFRYVLGTPTTRPRGQAVAQAMALAGHPITILKAAESTDRGRRYRATTHSGDSLHVIVLDRDLEGAGVIPRWWRSLRLRDNDALGGWTMREAVERSALMSYAAQAVGAPVPQLKLVRAVGEDASVLAYEYVEGETLESLLAQEKSLDESALRTAWSALATLHRAGIAHRGISVDHMICSPENEIRIVHITSGTVAMSELQERIDTADMLIALALVSSPEDSVASAVDVLGRKALTRALPALQPFALSKDNRKRLRKHKQVLPTLRKLIAELAEGEAVESISIERLSPRKLLSVVALIAAAYILIDQFAQVDVFGLFRSANYAWVLVAAVMSLITYIGSAMSLTGFVVEKLSAQRTFLAQFAASFAALVSPPTLGTVAVNGRYLQKSGLPPAAAGAAVAVSQVVAFIIHIGLLFIAGIATGTDVQKSFDPPPQLITGVAIVVGLLAIILPLPKVRKYLVKIARPRLEEVIPRLITVTSQPAKLATGIGGILILNVAFCITLIACVWAFDGGGTVAAISLVYLAGSTLGQAAPTPGGIGAVEAVMTAGLVAVGIDPGIALSSVLLYRLLTFWIPTIPGWFAFQYLTKNNHL
jgi:uncharacterized protein (TIRG00374 family)